MKRKLAISSAAALALLAGAGTAEAVPKLRKQVEQKGDFILVGNTLGYECNVVAGPPTLPVAPIGPNTTADCTGSLNNGDTAPDLFWRADQPGPGQAVTNTGVTVVQARSAAKVNIPAGAT